MLRILEDLLRWSAFHEFTVPHDVDPPRQIPDYGEIVRDKHDRQTGAACSETEPLATLPIDGEAGDNLLIAIYREGNDVKLLSAPLE